MTRDIPTTAVADPQDRAHRPLLDLVAAYESAFNANDALAMNDLFSEDCVFVNFGGNVVRGRTALLAAQAAVFDPGGALTSISVRYEPELVTFLGPTVAVVHARQRSVGATDGSTGADDPMEAVLAVTVEQTPVGWRIRLGQNTPVRR